MRTAMVLAAALLAACGDDSGAHPDGAMPDGSGSADAPGAAAVHVTITGRGQARPGVQVYFQNADSTLAGMGMTDASGAVAGPIGAGGFVTALDPFASQQPETRIYTVAGVQPGEHLAFDGAFQDTHETAGTPTSVSFTVTVPSTSGAATYELMCAGGGHANVPAGAATAVTLADCPATGDLLVIAKDAGGALASSFWARDVMFSASPTLDLSSDPYEPFAISTTEAPAAFTVHPIDLLATGAGDFTAPTLVDSDPATNTYSFHLPQLDGANNIAVAEYGDSTQGYEVFRYGPGGGDFAFDLASQGIAALPATASFDSGGLHWTTDGTGAAPDFAYVRATVGGAEWWLASAIATSGTASTVAFPQLPLSQYAVTASTPIEYVERWSAVGGWDARRPRAFEEIYSTLIGETGAGIAAEAVFDP
ncbi:MAG TPA: hypothetical protein VGM88_16860 [Kofleriaceae bacterium]